MKDGYTLAFVIFPYIALTTFVVGHLYRYMTDAYRWNARSSELLAKESLRAGSWLFHWGMILVLIGHSGGLLIPQSVYDAVGISDTGHMRIAYLSGMLIGFITLAGVVLLIFRRLLSVRLLAVTSLNDWVTLALLFLVITIGTYAVFGHYNVLYSVAPWIRSIVALHPNPELMRSVPLVYKIHILAAFALFGFSPFSRLVHIWSVPVTYPLRSYIVFRKRQA
ncbi:MAG: respiratory nitrate reductase subunit gamma [bacterium]